MRKAKGLVLRSDSSFAVALLRRKDFLRRVAFTPLEGPRLAGTQIRIPNRQSGRFLAGRVSPKDSFRRRNLSNRAAFTLIELLVVISILVLLMAILLPTLQRVRNQARAVVCHANLRQWGTLLALYVEDNQGRFPRAFITTSFLRASLFGADYHDERMPRLNGDDIKGILCCPTAVRPRDKRTGPNDYRIYDYTFRAWELSYKGVSFRGSYGFNEWLLMGLFDESIPYLIRREGIDVFSLRGRGNIPTLLDCTEPDDRGLHSLMRPPRLEGLGSCSFCINRHNGHINGLFLDWSVRKVGLKELWTLKWRREFDTTGPWTTAGGVLPEDWPQWMRRFKDY